MMSEQEAIEAIKNLHETMFDGMKMRCEVMETNNLKTAERHATDIGSNLSVLRLVFLQIRLFTFSAYMTRVL